MRPSEVETRAPFSSSSPSSARLAWLIEISRLLISAVDLDHLLGVILKTSSQLVGSEDSSLLLLDPATNELVFVMAHGSVSDKLKMMRLKPGEGIAGWVAQHGKPLLVNDVEQDSRFSRKVDKLTGYRTKAVLAVPLQDHGRRVGVLEVVNPRKDRLFNQEDPEYYVVRRHTRLSKSGNARLRQALYLPTLTAIRFNPLLEAFFGRQFECSFANIG